MIAPGTSTIPQRKIKIKNNQQGLNIFIYKKTTIKFQNTNKTQRLKSQYQTLHNGM
jgi:hypothetical protein